MCATVAVRFIYITGENSIKRTCNNFLPASDITTRLTGLVRLLPVSLATVPSGHGHIVAAPSQEEQPLFVELGIATTAVGMPPESPPKGWTSRVENTQAA